jgi:hypothetical protein
MKSGVTPSASIALPHPERLVGRLDRSRRVHQILVADLIDIAFGPECQLGGRAFGPFVDQRSNVAVKGASIEVPLDEVLLYLRPQRLQQETHMPEDRIVPQHRVLSLNEVVDAHGCNHRDQRCGDPPHPRPQQRQRQQCRGQGCQQCDRGKANHTGERSVSAKYQ